MKKRLRRREVRPVDVLTDVPDYAVTMHVMDFLLAIPKVGRVKANRALSKNLISPSKTLGGMTDRQREALISVLV